MSKSDKVTLQCADCGCEFVRTIEWLENSRFLYCVRCQIDLDIDEVIYDIFSSDELEREEVYLVYHRYY